MGFLKSDLVKYRICPIWGQYVSPDTLAPLSSSWGRLAVDPNPLPLVVYVVAIASLESRTLASWVSAGLGVSSECSEGVREECCKCGGCVVVDCVFKWCR